MGFTDIFDELEPAERVRLLNQAVNRSFEPGTVIIDERKPNDAIFVVMDGEVNVEKSLPNGEKKVLAELGVGAIIGEMTFLTRGSPSASIVARTETEMLCVTHESLNTLVSQEPGLAGRFYRSIAVTLAQRLAETNKKLTQSQT